MLDVIIDQNTPIYGHLARLCERLRGVPTPPIVRGVGPTPIPRPERLYVWFGDPIDTTRFGSRFDDTTAVRALRDEVKQAIIVGSYCATNATKTKPLGPEEAAPPP